MTRGTGSIQSPMSRPFSIPLMVLLTAVLALPAGAQAQVRTRLTPPAPRIPDELMPPPGKCRIWMENVPAAQQPAPTDCRTALRQKPANGTVIFGPNEREGTSLGFLSGSRGTREALRGAAARRDSVRRDSLRRDSLRVDSLKADSLRRAAARRDSQPASKPDSTERPS